MLDVAIIGSGPAGVAAAINVRQRNRSLVLLGAAEVSRKLESAQEIANYPGFPEIGGAALGEAFHRHLDALGIAVEIRGSRISDGRFLRADERRGNVGSQERGARDRRDRVQAHRGRD